MASVIRVREAFVADGAARVHAARAAVEDCIADLPNLSAHTSVARARVILVRGRVAFEHAAAITQHSHGLQLVLLQVADGVLAHALDRIFGCHNV